MINIWIKMCIDFLVSLYYSPESGKKFNEDEKKLMWNVITMLRGKMTFSGE
jgi:hypothetical protein